MEKHNEKSLAENSVNSHIIKTDTGKRKKKEKKKRKNFQNLFFLQSLQQVPPEQSAVLVSRDQPVFNRIAMSISNQINSSVSSAGLSYLQFDACVCVCVCLCMCDGGSGGV